ncbi:MAG TPA: hypothetical protein VL123_02625 [Candidatus Udaeobacter sp.]|jgi:hypothetical protein|nr:hypothetical protein [Candidatus Udaeobacter sp.]
MRFPGSSRIGLAAGVILLGLAQGGPARSDVAVHIDIGNAPPPPRVVFRSEPHVVYVPEDRVYVVDDPYAGDNDYFRYGPYWYEFNAGYWYRASSWRGPFRVVEPRYVPAAIYRVPPGHWKHRAHWMPPGQARKYGYDDDRGRGNGHGNGKGHGHGHGND